jgi:hypothetical protein
MRMHLFVALMAAVLLGGVGSASEQALTAQDLVDPQQPYARHNWLHDSGAPAPASK